MSITMVSQNLEQADKRVLKAFTSGALGYKAEYDRVFIIETPERRNERFTIVKTDSGVSEVQDGGAFPTQGINELGANEISVRVYKGAIPISDLSDLFDNYGAIEKVAMTRGYHFKAKTDQLCADFLNNGTSTSAPYGINVAGSTTSLFSTTQPIGDSGLTQSNRQSGALDKSTLNSARVLMRKMKDHDGMIANYQARRLVTPPEETMNAWQITYSRNEPESANRNDNYINTLGLELIEWPLLSSTTACFLLADKSDVGCKGLRLEVKEMPSMRRIMDPATGNWVYTMRMVLFPGVVDYMGAVSIGL
jgi:hypothetical protein